MKVALVCPYSWSRPGGVQTHVGGLAHALRARGLEVDVLAPADDPVDFPGFRSVGRAVAIPDNGSRVPVALSPGAARGTAAALREGGYDLVHVHEPVIPAVSLTALFAAPAPLVGTFHMYASGPRWYRPFAQLARRALARLDARIAVSEPARMHVSRVCPGDYSVIPNGVDVARIVQRQRARSGSRIVFVGRPERRKGLPVLFDALRRLPPHATLDLIGVAPAELKGRRRVPGELAGRVRAHGRVSDEERIDLLARSDVLCAPSLAGESFGIVLVEGMAAGLPVVASAIPGYEGVLPEACGRLVPPGDAHALAAALTELLADEALRLRLGAAGRREASRYDWSRVCDEILAVYRAVGARPALTRAA